MEMIYAALLLHSLGKKIDESGIEKVIEAAGADVKHLEIKALVAKLKNIDINEAIKGASFFQAAPASAEKPKEEKTEAKKEEKAEEKAEEAAAGLSALFG